ncbi:GNAT family N-acetyltransferase [Petrocella atlantisensis]|uniref:GNAT family N-acetyltransferase n=1 Tax=Petrocella atlantisensis TaxID=2173034 RepID=A0A3P7NUV4_9FIRM|nr:GNAT family N-acetyltransferase [Petrocella atlantisensis]VDN46665.1 GNAT family N-acetyltransferase [Petrocella atlantisensis]
MKIEMIRENKKRYLDLLLLADEQEDMIDLYLERGDMFALFDDDLKSVCVVTQEEDGIYELKNIATYESCQKQGYGKGLIKYLFEHYQDRCKIMYVGTGDSPQIIRFYESCGFELSHRVKNFFVDHYDKPMYDCGIQLVDMVYLKKFF